MTLTIQFALDFRHGIFDKQTSFRFIPPDRTLWLDKGFQGVQHPPKNVMMPKKKPKNAQLTTDEKAENRVISALRMPIDTFLRA